MRLALLSDIHANLQALEACLAHARAQGADQLAVLGDLVGYGADPARVVERVMALVADGAVAIRGNHDAMAVQPPAGHHQTLGEFTALWTHEQLSETQRQFLAGLPMTERIGRALLVHATADNPALWRYAYDAGVAELSLQAASADADVRYVFGGHVHRQSLYSRGADGRLMPVALTVSTPVPVPAHCHWLATVGSVGQPRDGNFRAMYALFDSERSQLTFHRVLYDVHAAAEAIRAAGLPAFFADRLELGR